MVNKLLTEYNGKKVLITGHTGFKGSWMSHWLHLLGAELYGISKNIPSTPSLFLENEIGRFFTKDIRSDILDKSFLKEKILEWQPDFIFHMAAQPIVSISYQDPFETFASNTLGYASILDSCRDINFPCVVILVSSDKCYKNKEWIWGYRENDELGGQDPYSASKAAGEIIFHSFFYSFFQKHPFVKISSVRAGNVIGGGDWSKDRVIPDTYRSWYKNQKVILRRPDSVRPWQFVLEPLYGYLLTAITLQQKPELSGEFFNFGPDPNDSLTVKEIISYLNNMYEGPGFDIDPLIPSFYETGLLQLNSDKAKKVLGWKPILSVQECINWVSIWYSNYNNADSVFELVEEQINSFQNKILGLK